MDIIDPLKKFNKILERLLKGKNIKEEGLLDEEKDLLKLAKKINEGKPEISADENFRVNLRKRLMNLAESERFGAFGDRKLLERGDKDALLPRGKRFRWAYATVPIAVVALLVFFTSFAAASPGFYEKYVPKPVKKALEKTEVVKTGSINVISEPSEAEVYLNGKKQGNTPLLVEGVRMGEHGLDVKLAGFEGYGEKIDVTREETFEINIVLNKTEKPKVKSDHKKEEKKPKSIPEPKIERNRKELLYVGESEGASKIDAVKDDGKNVRNLIKFDEPISSAVFAKDNSIFYAVSYQEGDVKRYAVRKIDSGGKDSEAFSIDKGYDFAGEFAVSLDVSKVAYAVYKEGIAELRVKAIGETSAKIIYKGEPANIVDISSLKFDVDGKNVFFETATRGTPRKFFKVDVDSQKAAGYEMPNDIFGALDINLGLMKAVFVGTSGKVYLSNLKNFNTDVLLEFSGEKFSQATWVGSGNVAVVSAGGVSLINIDSKERKDIFKNAPNEKVSEIIADNNGEVVAYSVTGSEDIHFYIMNSGEEFISEKNVNPSMLLGFSGIGVIDYQIDVKFPEDEKDGSDEELKLLSKIGNLSGKASSDVHIDGNYLYRINVEGDLLEVFDISDKKNPKEIASVIDTVNINSGEIDSYLFDGYLYIAGGPLAIIDVTNSSVPKLIYSSEHMDARHVAVFGNYAYVAGKDRFTVMNVSDKAKPQIVFDTKASDLNVAVLPEKQAILKELSEVSLWGDLELSSDGKRLYAGCGDKGLKILDVSNPEVPKVLYRENTGFVSEIAGTGENVYVGRKSLGADVFVGAKKIGSIDEQLFGNGFEISEQKLYSISPKIAVYDLSDPLKPSQLTELENSDTMKDRRAINVEGNIMVVLAEDLYIYSVNLDKK